MHRDRHRCRRWEKLRVPLSIRIDLGRTVLDDYKAQLRGLPRFGWQGWNQAANWAAQNGIDLDDAMAWADRSISMNRNFANLRTKALVLTVDLQKTRIAAVIEQLKK